MQLQIAVESSISESPFEFEIYTNFLWNERSIKGVPQVLTRRNISNSGIQLVHIVLVHSSLLLTMKKYQLSW